MQPRHMKQASKQRIYSLDMARGFIVILSVFLSAIPSGGYEYFRHAEWYNITVIDLILPSFITIFGTSMAIAYQKGVNWGKFLKRTVRLIVYGILFTIIVTWSIDFTSIRLTGVLQMFAILGIITVLITQYIKSPKKLIIIALFLLFIYGAVTLISSQQCEDGLPQPSCNLSGIIDINIFGENHVYAQGTRGFDPEGLVTSFAALANVLLGYAIGRFMIIHKESKPWKHILFLGLFLIVLSIIAHYILPYNKRIWTPSFALLAAGTTSLMIATFYLVFDNNRNKDAKKTVLAPIVWFFEAFGRNSFLVYFGKFIIASVLTHIMITVNGKQSSIYSVILSWVESFSTYPQLTYAFLMLLFWIIITLILHKKKLYVKV
ncbi:putative acyltransferase [Metabacillus crassostreae]|uniref:acyltransferase family protein n=1 Tax=Metabacillus crassostreae TaxID=929098 RepID=UPI00195BC4F8|nr:heparan-alpha-glucosaminide N-acetyltransferase domain-containing protein [Metabacillus crassostreae]MBM7606373.1 putative acyltransferase [Metabacillus crassostreae]